MELRKLLYNEAFYMHDNVPNISSMFPLNRLWTAFSHLLILHDCPMWPSTLYTRLIRKKSRQAMFQYMRHAKYYKNLYICMRGCNILEFQTRFHSVNFLMKQAKWAQKRTQKLQVFRRKPVDCIYAHSLSTHNEFPLALGALPFWGKTPEQWKVENLN